MEHRDVCVCVCNFNPQVKEPFFIENVSPDKVSEGWSFVCIVDILEREGGRVEKERERGGVSKAKVRW